MNKVNGIIRPVIRSVLLTQVKNQSFQRAESFTLFLSETLLFANFKLCRMFKLPGDSFNAFS